MAKPARLILIAIIAITALSPTYAVRGATPPPPIDEGRQAITALDWKSAIRYYTPLAAAASPGSADWTRATFCLAVAQQQFQPASTETMNPARQLYQSIIDQSKELPFVARSMMNIGRIAELKDFSDDAVDLPRARKYYARVIERFASDPIASEAVLREAAAYIMEYDAPAFTNVKAGVALLEKWIADHPNDGLASVMWQTAGDAYFMPLDDWKNALRCYENVDQLGWTDQGNQGAWYWRCAKMAEKLNDTKTAIKYYTKIINETPSSGQGYASVLALRKLGAPVPFNALFEDSPTSQPAAKEATR